MDFQAFADSFDAPTCILSVEKTPDDGYDAIRIVAGNRRYIEPLERPFMPPELYMPGVPDILLHKHTFIPNSRYEEYLPKDLGFEDICFRAAVRKIPIHTYVHMNNMNIWFDIFSMPLTCDNGDLCYCIYTAQPCSPEEVGISSSQSGTASEDVLKACIKLHSSNDFQQTINEVVDDIRLICRAEVCTIMLMDQYTRTHSVLSASIDENSSTKQVTEFSNFYDIAASWVDMIGGSDCMIIKDESDRNHIREVNALWYQTFDEAGVESFVLFPLRHDDEVLGFIWATNFDTTNTMRIKETLELIAYFLSSKLSNHKMMERLKQLSYTDMLTSLPNRFACSDLLRDAIRHGEPFTVVSIDINAFKSINDTMGFQTGNEVLIEIANRWRTIVASGISGTKDHIARQGGDEFLLVIRDYHSEEDVLKTIRMYESVLSNRLTVDDCDLYITASFGYASYPADASSTDTLLTYANAAMHEIKQQASSNHILHFTPDLLRIERTLEIERLIREALANDSISFHLQPQYDMAHKLRGFETLARLKDADGNFVSPAEFIPVAEKAGLIDKLDVAVYRKSTAFFGELLKKTGADLTLSINVSVRHLMKNDFFDEIRDLLKNSGVPAERLEIEITESIMIDSAEKALRCIDSIKYMGIHIAIDDFGTGYSALSYLNSFPADLLKIDKSFIDKMNVSESSKQYVAAIISMGHIMGFDVIAEGVELPEQVETLRSIGCDYIQGFVWGRPMIPEAAEELVFNKMSE